VLSPATRIGALIPFVKFRILPSSEIVDSALKSRKLVIAIDGPAASGKSTTAKLTAERLGYLHIDTGAMYRAMTLKVLQEKISLDDHARIGRLAERTGIRFRREHGDVRVLLDNQDVTKAIRSRTVTSAVSAVSSIKKVREVMVREQRRMGEEGGIVLEGRDIGTVVFPAADLKIFMVADVEERARRRQRELKEQGVEVDVSSLREELDNRDRQDSKRDISPLKKADDAIVLDTSNMTIDEQVEFIVKKAREVIGQPEKKNT
jgi:cytidylate kinase